ncbi:MAG: UDP-N-acetylmuramate dehydrogenase [Acidobacteriota bacterium]|nr:UDP-N-acetylmuramate dehydrogenase [Acidobacteriota bacterium]
MPTQPLIQENVPLAPLTTLGIGGSARFFAEAVSESELIAAIEFSEQRVLPVFILGGGSNVLVSDEGFSGLVIRVAIKGISSSGGWDRFRTCPTNEKQSKWTEQITVGAGEGWDDFARQCVERNLAGVECLSGIPGLVGGTPVQNVGAYGQDVSETITRVRAFDRQTKQIVELSNAECGFSYRASIFNSTERDRYVVLAVTYSLKQNGEPALRYPDVKNFFAGRNDKPSLAEVRQAIIEIRSRKGMVIVPDDAANTPESRSAGSFFKNPVISAEAFAKLEATASERPPSFPATTGYVKVPAAWLIERAGFTRGYAKGRAGISSKHTLAIINRGGATANEILDLVSEIQTRVAERFGVELKPEPVFVGFSS